MKIKVGNAGGFGNRIYAWDCMYELSKINDAELECDFPELEFITLPNTTQVFNFDYSGAPDYNSLNYSQKLNNGYISFDSTQMSADFKLNSDFNYYSMCGFGFNRYFNNIHKNTGIFPKQKMKFKDNIIFEKIKDTVKDCVGVHIRRGEAGNGNHDRFDISRQGTSFYPYGTIPDFWYLSLMNDIKEIKPDVKFYISSNAKKEDLQIFYDNFDIVTYRDILLKESDHAHLNTIEVYEEYKRSGKIVDTDLSGIVDIFSLAFSKMLISSISTWSMCAYEFNNIPTIWPEIRYQKLDSLKKYRGGFKEMNINITDIL